MTWERMCEWYGATALVASLLLLLSENQEPAAIFAATGYLAMRST